MGISVPNLRKRSLLQSLAAVLLGMVLGAGIQGLSQEAVYQPAEMLAKARTLSDAGDFAAAETALRQVIAREPDSPAARYLLGYVLFREQKLTDALAMYTAAARLRRPAAGDLRTVAAIYVLLKDYPDAEHWLIEATHLAPTDADLWYLLGRTQYNLDHAAIAATSFERSLALRPRNSKAEYNLGLCYEMLQRTEDALAAYRLAIEWQTAANIRDPQPFLDLGMLLLQQQHPEQALTALREAAEQGSANPLAQQELGLALEALGRYAEALGPLQRAVLLAPEADQAHFFLGRIYHRLGRKPEADAQYAIVAQLSAARSNTATPNRNEQP